MSEPTDTPTQYRSVAEREKKLNENAENRSVLDSIDRPIRPLVLEMNRIGLRTRFCCCGYSYVGEEEPKSHSPNTYVLFEGPDLENPEETAIFFRFANVVKNAGWNLCYETGEPFGEWCVWTNRRGSEWTGKDGLKETVHHYEGRIIAIDHLVGRVKKLPTFKPEFTVVDGNHTRIKYHKDEWIVKPKADHKCIISKEVLGEYSPKGKER